MKINEKYSVSPLNHLFFKELFETQINTNLNMKNFCIKNVLTSSNDANAANLGQAEELANTSLSKNFLPITGNSIEKPVTGDLTFNGKATMTQLASPINDSDIVNLQTLSSLIEKFLTIQGTTPSNPFYGNISFDNAYSITGLSNPKEPTDAVNLQTLTSFFNENFLKKGDSLLGALNINNQNLTNLNDPKELTDGINLQTVKRIIKTTQKNFIPLTGTSQDDPVTGNLILNNQKITGLNIAKNTSDGVNFNLLKTTLNKYLLKSGGGLQNPLDANNNFISNLGTPQNNLDLINKGFLTKSLSRYIKLSGDTTTGNIDLNTHNIINLKNPVSNDDGVNLQTLKTKAHLQLNTLYIPLSGTLPNAHITGDLIFNNASTITNLSNPKQNTDIVNLQYLQQTANNYCLVTGDSLQSDLNLDNNLISGISDPITDNDALNLQTLENLIKEDESIYIPFTGNTANTPITGNLVLKNTNISQIPSAKEDLNIINAQDLTNAFSNKFLLSGDTFSGTLNISNKIINVANPNDNNTPNSTNKNAINFETMTNNLANSMLLTGGTINYELINNSVIKNLSNFPGDQDAVNLQTLNQIISSNKGNYVPLSGNTNAQEIVGNLVFNNALVSGLNDSNTSTDTDAVNYKTVTTKFSHYMPLDGSSPLSGPLSLNDQQITNLSYPNNPEEAANLQALDTIFTKHGPFLPLSGGTMTGPINDNNQIINNLTPNITQTYSTALTLFDLDQFFFGPYYSMTNVSNADPSHWNYNVDWKPQFPLSWETGSGELIGSPNQASFFQITNAYIIPPWNNGGVFGFGNAALHILSPGLYSLTFYMKRNKAYNPSLPITVNTNNVQIILYYNTPSTYKILNAMYLLPEQSCSSTTVFYIDPSFLNPFLILYNNDTYYYSEQIFIYDCSWSINKIIG